MRVYEKRPIKRLFEEPEIVELGIDDEGTRQWYRSEDDAWRAVGEEGTLYLHADHFKIGTRITIEEPIK